MDKLIATLEGLGILWKYIFWIALIVATLWKGARLFI